MKLILERYLHYTSHTVGRLYRPEGAKQIHTIERPWLGNKPWISCIPDGEYQLDWHTGRRWSNVPILLDVPGRSYILIHPGNSVEDSAGCILVGSEYDGRRLGSSRPTLETLVRELQDDTNTIAIRSFQCATPAS